MAMTQADRSAKTAQKRRTGDEEELRMWAKPGTRQVLKELMEWHSIGEQAEAMTLVLHWLHSLGPEGSAPFFAPPRHDYVIPEKVARKLELAYQRESLRISHDE